MVSTPAKRKKVEATDITMLKSFTWVIENLSHAFYLVDSKWRVVYCNKKAEELLQTTREKLRDKNMWAVFPQTKKTAWHKYFHLAKRTKKTQSFEAFSTRLSKWFATRVYPTKDGLYVFFSDITERKTVEQRNEFQANILKNITNSIIVTDVKGRVTYWNEGAEKVYGYTSSHMLGKALDAIYPDTISLYYKKLRNIQKGSEFSGEWKAKRKNGTDVWLQLKTTPLQSNGKIVGFIGVASDITEKKEYEIDLLKFKLISENAHEGHALLDREGSFLYVNKARCEMLGYTEDELLTMGVKDVDKSFNKKTYQEFIDQGRDRITTSLETEYTRKDGSTFPAEVSLSIVTIKGERSVFSVTRDITQRKKYEADLLRFKLISENSHEGHALRDREARLVYVNRAKCQMLGYTEQELLNKNVQDIDVLFDKKSYRLFIDHGREGETKELETTYVRKDRTRFPAEVSLSIVNIGGKRYVFTVMRDTTERKQIEENLQFLTKASIALSSPLDYKTTLQSIAELAVPNVADWCVVQLFDSSGKLELVALAHQDERKVKWVQKLRKINPIRMSEKYGIEKIVKTGRPIFLSRLSKKRLRSSIKNKAEELFVQRLGVTGVIVVPVKRSGRVVGGIIFLSTESKRAFTKTDLHMAEQLASRVSLGIENARLYQAVEDERERLDNLVTNVPGIVWEAWGNPQKQTQRIDFVSRYIETMLGYSVKEWLRTPNFWLNIVHPDDRKRAGKEASAIFAGGGTGISRFRWIAKNGEVKWVEAQSSVMKDEKGNPIGMRGVTMDITERMEQEQRKDDFISMASHELKTPVTSLKVYTQLMQRQAITKDGQSALTLKKMDTQIDKLTTLIADLLDISRIQEGKLEYRKERFDLNGLVEEIIENIQATYKTHQIHVIGDVKKPVFADRDRIGQVLINLIVNAIKYSPKADRVDVQLSNTKGKVTVTIRDYGIGIAKEQQAKIFNRFYQVTGVPEKTFPGLGIGLYISGQIIKRHEGKIWVESEKGKGSSFIFTLPVRG